MPREASDRSRDAAGREHIKERNHSSSSSIKREKPGPSNQAIDVSKSASTSKVVAMTDRSRPMEDKDGKKSRLRPPPTVGSSQKIPQPQTGSNTAVKQDGESPEDEASCTMDRVELYTAANKFDEDEAKAMDPKEATEMFLEYCAELEEAISEIFEIKKQRAEDPSQQDSTHDFSSAERKAVCAVTQMRYINRLIKLRVKSSKEAMIEQRQIADKYNLELQNLLYEAIHLRNQVLAVKDYKSTDEQIDLVPLEQFYKDAPAKISKPHITEKDSHLLRIARLEYEFIQRQQLTQECNELEKKKEEISNEIIEQRKTFDSVKPMLSSILAALEPTQEFFDPGSSARNEMHELAKFLPPPLYVLYYTSVGYQEFLGSPNFSICIKGDVDAAKETVKPFSVQIPLESDSDMEIDESTDADTELPRNRRSIRKHVSIMEERQDHAKRLVETHPLYFEWTIVGEDSESLTITFYYMTRVRVVTVKTVLTSKIQSESSKEILRKERCILEELFPNDTGIDSPNPATSFYLNLAGANSFSEFIDVVGNAYLWAQQLAGIVFPVQPKVSSDVDSMDEYDFLPLQEVKPNHQLSASRMDIVFKKIKRRLKCQCHLWAQLRNLETRSLQVPSEFKKYFPTKNSASLTSWEAIDWNTYKSYTATSYPVSIEIVTSNFTFFKAVVERARAHVIALVAITLSYPDDAPIFSVQLDDAAADQNGTDACVFRDIERELNIHAVREFGRGIPCILTLQLQRLIYCADVLLETSGEDGSAGPSEFAREKLFESRVKGKNFRRPFMFVPKLGGHFTQRF